MLTKIARLTACAFLLTAGLILGGLYPPQAQAAITSSAWTTLRTGNAYPSALAVAYTVPAGTNRIVLVAVSSARTTVGTQTYTIKYGGSSDATSVALTRINGNETSATPRLHSALFMLSEAQIAAATTNNFYLTVSGGTSTFTHIMAATFAGVDQNTPYNTSTGTRNYSSGTGTTAAPAFATALTENIGEQPVVIVNSLRTGSTTARTITAAANWSIPTGANLTGANTDALRSTMVTRTQPVTNTSDTAPATISTASLASMTGVSLAPAPTAFTLTVSGNTAIATGNRLDTDTGVLMQRLQVQGSGTTVLNSLTLENPGTANQIASAEIYIADASQATLPGTAVLIGSAVNWTGLSTPIPLDQGAAADRTVGTTAKYLYIVYDMAIGQASQTVGSRVTAVGVESPNTGATGLNFSSNLLTLDISGNAVTVPSSTPIVSGTAKDSDDAVLMLRFPVNCNSGFDSAAVLNSLTIEDLGTKRYVASVKVYISASEELALPAAAKLIGVSPQWDKTATPSLTIALDDAYGASSSDRTVTAASPKYVYVVYSMFYVDDADWIAGQTMQARVTAVGAASPDSGASGLALLSNSITLTRGAWSKITSCEGCHNTASIQDGTSRNNPDGKFPGSHYTHSNRFGYDCSKCHVKPALNNYQHASGNVDMGGDLAGGSYSKGDSFAVSNSPTFGTCGNIYCHSNGLTVGTGGTPVVPTPPTWAGSTLNCGSCHGSDTSGAPAYANLRKIPSTNSGTGWTNPANAYGADGANASISATNALLLTGYGYTVTDVPADATVKGFTVTVIGYGSDASAANRQLSVQLVKNGTAVGTATTLQLPQTAAAEVNIGGATNLWGTTWAPADVTTANFGVSISHTTTTGTVYIDVVKVNVFTNTAPKANSHPNHAAYSCNACHASTVNGSGAIIAVPPHVNQSYDVQANGSTASFTYAAGACSGVNCHGPATWGVTEMGCVNCHTSAQGTRSPVVAEFGLAWGHKKSGRGAVTDADCIVCHLEGNGTTHKTSSTYHKNGAIDLRDPDGAGETLITDVSGNPFGFAKFATSYAAGSRTSTGHLSNNVDNVLSQKFCLACHDGNGATNPTALTAGGTATMPWGGVNLGANYTVANGSAVAGGLVNVKAQFATTNSSVHPLMGPRNADYPTAARLANPYKPTGSRGTSGTRSQGVVMNCFDCHNTPTPLTNRTIVAHGNAVTLRGTPAVSGTPVATTNEATLCNACHLTYRTTAQHHGTGSAFTDGHNTHTAFVEYGCNKCHASSYDTAAVRPVRSMDVHGVSILPSGGLTKTTRWLGNSVGSPAQVNVKPYAFIRNTQQMTNHQPRVIGTSTYSPSCSGMGGTTCNDGSRTETYTIGGTY